MLHTKHDLDKHVSKASKLSLGYSDSSVLKQWDVPPHFKGYHLRTPHEELLKTIANDPEVQLVESNSVFSASCRSYRNDNWGAVRSQKSSIPDYALDRYYRYNEYNGSGVNVYLVDSGITNSDQFGHVTIRWGTDTVDSPSPLTDEHGHGTSMAGVIASKSFGMARGVTMVVVRVLDENKRGTTTNMLSGLQWVINDYKSHKKHSIINFSINLNGIQVSMVHQILSVIAAGIPFVCSAGNFNMDACGVTPSLIPLAITVGATTKMDAFCPGTCYGRCVNIMAPGQNIMTTTREGGTHIISGSSPAAAHVTAVLARRIQATNNHDVSKLAGWLYASGRGCSTPTLGNLPSGTTNKLVFGPCNIDD